MNFEQLPERRDVREFEVVNRILQFVRIAHVAVFHAAGPLDVVDAVDALQKRRQPLQTISDLGGHQVQIDAAALLEISELRDFEPIQHHLPAHAPCAERWIFPVVFFEFQIVLAEIDPDGLEAAHVLFDHVGGRWLQDHLKLHVLVEAIRIVAIAPVRGPAAGLHVRGAVWLGARARAETSRDMKFPRRLRRRTAPE